MSDLREIIDVAAKRVDYRLTYGRTKKPRTPNRHGISGPDIPNAYHRGDHDGSAMGSGDWEDPEFVDAVRDAGGTEEDAIRRWFMVAIREAMHEAMEWFWVDGKIFLDPHGEHEMAIHDISERAAKELIGLVKP